MPQPRRTSLALTVGALAAVACDGGTPTQGAAAQNPAQGAAQRSPTPAATAGVVQAETVARGLNHPWGLAILPDGRMLVTERPGRLRVVTRAGQLSAPVTGVPAVYAQGQGGLLDVTLAPDFATSRLVYLSFAEPGDGGSAGTAVARGRLSANDAALENVQVIYRQTPKVAGGSNHFGSRLVFAPDGKLFVTQGDRYTEKERAQDLSTTIGKVVRVNADGSVPQDNPFVGRANARGEIWSYGHRNVQAATLDPSGRLWTIEHGARGGDELNRPEAGKNYGWPVITYGIDYSGARIGEGTAKAGMEQPVYYWDPVIAPSGATFVSGNAYPGWAGSLVVGSLGTQSLVRLTLQDGRVAREERFLGGVGRVRDVQQGPDGLLYLVTDADDGQVVRVVPAGGGRAARQ